MQVFELGDQLGFSLEAPDEFRLVGELGQDDLDGYFPLNKLLAGAVYLPIGTLTDAFDQFVAFNGAGKG